MLELKEVTKKFGDRTILDHVDLTVEAVSYTHLTLPTNSA